MGKNKKMLKNHLITIKKKQIKTCKERKTYQSYCWVFRRFSWNVLDECWPRRQAARPFSTPNLGRTCSGFGRFLRFSSKFLSSSFRVRRVRDWVEIVSSSVEVRSRSRRCPTRWGGTRGRCPRSTFSDLK